MGCVIRPRLNAQYNPLYPSDTLEDTDIPCQQLLPQYHGGQVSISYRAMTANNTDPSSVVVLQIKAMK